MGCDIHVFVEKKINGKWEAVANPTDPHHFEDWIYDDRNYHLFALWADVRNDYDFVPISEAKGFPDDGSEIVRKSRYGYWEDDAHSTSWLSLREMLEYDYEKYVTFKGGISPQANKELIEHGTTPSEWTMYSSKPGNLVWTEWKVHYKDAFGWIFDNVYEKLKSISDGNYDDIRIVFWFDN